MCILPTPILPQLYRHLFSPLIKSLSTASGDYTFDLWSMSDIEIFAC